MDASFKIPGESTQDAQEQSASSSKPTPAPSTPASPMESAEAYENVCGICFTEIHHADNPRGRLNSCNHLFCSYCIKEWAKNTNVCPSCKARFTRIYTFHTDTQLEEETKVRRRNYKAWELTYYDEDEEEWEDSARPEPDSQEQVMCDICQQSHNAARMIFCDRRQCPYAAHLDCLGLAERPLTFLCPPCTQLREQEKEADTSVGSVSSSSVHSPFESTEVAAVALRKDNAASAYTAPRARSAATSRVPASSSVRATPTAAAASRGTDARHIRGSARLFSSLPSSTSRASGTAPGSPTRRRGRGSNGDPGLSSSPSPSRRTEFSSPANTSVVVPLAPTDFSKPHIPLPPPPTVTQANRCHRHQSDIADAVEEEEDTYYFLSPTSHAVAASIELERFKKSHAADAQIRHQRERAKAARLESAYSGSRSDLEYRCGRKRPQRTAAEEFAMDLEASEKELTDVQLRRAMEEGMVRRWAVDILPVLRRRRYIEGDTVTSEADMWSQATAQARKMVREKLDAKSASLRRRRELLVRAQANREAAALAKLARIIAQHRDRDQQSHSHS
ncbi:hypothetical protein ABL78_2885 [Leptomonas seymouri]|uniref:RING-type domain-containing protein n=1 Tax=Leptomonas seymouri TaxID=5684 RepID=A0A0N0P6U0_LEPSE|nr:hypothetical protein ABL78_2885 [Leptomonas seymouri]|eukprot:KPI88009.1 hypothetical protein ABL78_2885 [Leptomonas seymouri]